MKAMSFAMLASLCLSTSAGAMDLKKYREMEQAEPHRTYNRIYLNGLIDGLGVANDALSVGRRALLYCQPKNLLLPLDQVKDMMFKEAAKANITDDADVQTALLVALKETFPCNDADNKNKSRRQPAR